MLKQGFKNYLIQNGLSTSTANSYASGIEKACKEEKCSWKKLKSNIATILPMYEKGGSKENIGDQLSGAVRAGLIKYEEFSKKHDWLMAEDFICCVFYIETYIKKAKTIHIDDLVTHAKMYLPEITTQSIKEKFRNIKQIVIEKGLPDSCNYSERPNVSKQNRVAFDDAYNLLK